MEMMRVMNFLKIVLSLCWNQYSFYWEKLVDLAIVTVLRCLSVVDIAGNIASVHTTHHTCGHGLGEDEVENFHAK